MSISSRIQQYFKPTENVRIRDFVRELPQATWNVAKQIPQDIVRFGISAYEAPRSIASGGKFTGGYYNTPIGRINSFQDEARNRVNMGQPMWKAMGNPMVDTVLAGSDISPILRIAEAPLETAYTAAKYKNLLRGNLKSGDPMVINPDLYKEKSAWRGMANPRYHEIFSSAADKAYNWALKNNKNPIVRRLAGGAASGKTEQLLNPLKRNFDGIILDKVSSNLEGFKRDYDAAKNAGKNTELYGILANLMEARKFSLKRELKNGRKIPIDQFGKGHAGSANTMLGVAKNYPDVKMVLKDNRNIFNLEQSLANPVMINRQQIINTLNSLGYSPQDIVNLVKNVSL